MCSNTTTISSCPPNNLDIRLCVYVSVCRSLSELTAISMVYLSQAWHLNPGRQLQVDVKLCEVLLISEWLTGSVHSVQKNNTHR